MNGTRALFVAAFAFFAAGCDAISIPFLQKDDPSAPPAPAAMTPAEPAAPPATPVAPVQAQPAGSFTWTAAPTVEAIPPTPVTAWANGRPMAISSVVFEPGLDQGSWRMLLVEKPLSQPTDKVEDTQYVSIDLPEMPEAGKSWQRKMEFGGGHFQVASDPAKPQETTSWNAQNTYAIQIDSWNAAPYDESKGVFQQAGTASGKIAVCYKGSAGIADSWAAGTFENAVVRYMGKPAGAQDASAEVKEKKDGEDNPGKKERAKGQKKDGKSSQKKVADNEISKKDIDKAKKTIEDAAEKHDIDPEKAKAAVKGVITTGKAGLKKLGTIKLKKPQKDTSASN